MGYPSNLQRKPAEWEKAVAKHDCERLGMEMLNEHIVFGAEVEGLDMDKYKGLLVKHGSRPYRGLGMNIIRVSYPKLVPYARFRIGWQDDIIEPNDNYGKFNPKERSKPWNYDAISVEGLLLDWMFEWRKLPLESGTRIETLCTITRVTSDAFEYNYRQKRRILIRPPMEGEYNWGNDMIRLLGAFVGTAWDKWYIKQDGVKLGTYKRVHDDGYPCRKHSWLTKMWG